MIKIAQFGEGNFLRSFADLYFETLNGEGGEYSVSVIQPIPSPAILQKFRAQDNRYHVVLRGMSSGGTVEDVYGVSVIDQVFSPFDDRESYDNLACDKDLKIIVSNTTEAGICFNDADRFDDFEKITYPAKLTKFLYKRFHSGLDGVYLMPVELIENNADELYRCVDKYITLWGLPKEFREWNDTKNFYCNTLVDRIVSGYPRDETTKSHLCELIGENDGLMSVAEPFGLWAVEKKGRIEKYIKEGRHNIDVVLTDNIAYYKKRKVRVLNGSHTNLVPVGLSLGAMTVYDCMTDRRLYKFFKDSLDEIIPFVSDNTAMTKQFAADVEERFFNPFLNHQLTSIALNSISKWRARVLPTFRDYYEKNCRIPEKLTVGFSYLMFLYKTRYDELKDDQVYIDFFENGGDIYEFMRDITVWGEDLTAYRDFYETVSRSIMRIENGEVLI